MTPPKKTLIDTLKSPTALLLMGTMILRLAYLIARWKTVCAGGMEYEALADSFLTQGKITFTHFIIPVDSAYMPPGTMAIIILAKSLFPSGHTFFIAALQWALACGALPLVGAVAEKVASTRAALAAMILYAVDINMLIPVAWVNETIYTMFFLLLSVHMTMLLVEQPTMKAAAGLGVAMGLGALFRSTLLPQFGLSAAWIIWSHLRDKRPLPLKHVATATVVFLLVLAPWTIRNYRVFGKIIPVSQNLGVNLWCGWNPHASGSECLMDGGRMLHEPALMKQLQAATSEPEIDRLYKQSAFDAASADPSRWLKQRLFSFLFFWHEHSFWAPKSPFHTLGWRLIGLLNLPFLALFFVGVAGVIRKNGLMRYVLLVMSGHCLIHTLIHAGIGSRFRYQIEPLMLIVIATFLVSRWPSLGDRLERWKGSLVISPR